jgi:hypothetical protein
VELHFIGRVIASKKNTICGPVIKIVNQSKASEKETLLKKRFTTKPDLIDKELQQVVTQPTTNSNELKKTIRAY